MIFLQSLKLLILPSLFYIDQYLSIISLLLLLSNRKYINIKYIIYILYLELQGGGVFSEVLNFCSLM